MLQQTHTRSGAIIFSRRLDPAITSLLLCDKNGVLLADFAVVMNFMTLVVRSIALVDLDLPSHFLLIVSALHRGEGHHRLSLVGMVKVGLFHELFTIRAHRIINLRRRLLESKLLLGLSLETAIAGLEVRALDVA